MVSHATEDDVNSIIFIKKANAIAHIASEYKEYKLIAQDSEEDVQCWRNITGECVLLEKIKVED